MFQHTYLYRVLNISVMGSSLSILLFNCQVLMLVRKLALLGYYDDFKEVTAALEPIMGLLSSEDDLPFQVPTNLDGIIIYLFIIIYYLFIIYLCLQIYPKTHVKSSRHTVRRAGTRRT